MKEVEITRRESILSIAIIAVMLIFGILITGGISQYCDDVNEKYNKAIKIDDPELFDYSMRTSAGNAFVYGTIKALEPVSFPEITGEYTSVTKIEEEYTMHTRTVTKTRIVNGKSQSYTDTEIYWTWDEVDRWHNRCKEVMFCGNKFKYGYIHVPKRWYIKTIYESSDIRYVYYGSPVSYKGTLFADLREGKAKDSVFCEGKTIPEAIKVLKSHTIVIIALFWVAWIILTCVAVFGFYYLDNKWLE